MKLLLFNEWIGQSWHHVDSKSTVELGPWIRDMAMATRLPLPEALAKVHEHQRQYAQRNSKTGMVVEFRLLSVCEIGEIDPELLGEFDAQMIEDLKVDDE